MELADGGSLNSYLKKHQLTMESRIRMCVDAACGLSYLHEKNCIHRDVAARNCLVSGHRVKLSDFGLAQQLEGDNAKVKVSRKEKLAVRWVAPESLKNMNYSLKSDVYSFGVLMWEIYSDAEVPYKGKTIQEVFQGIQDNKLSLSRPKLMPEEVSKVMFEGCLERNPEKRWPMSKVNRPSLLHNDMF